ncbi:polysaccharide deacetylase family protein [Roseivirga sp.]|uniref:polysaccharide deacetylase family protein n=1 Tax=Roseivirga sp. TaxID=1964215 RepID=UPI003B51E896
MLPFKTPFIAPYVYPGLLWKVKTVEKVLYLTFDDGPIPELTEWVLSQLEQHQAKATFFCVGENIIKHPQIYRSILSAGHSVGNHTQHHLNGKKTEATQYLSDVEDCDQVMTNAGSTTSLFRPPYGRLTNVQRKTLLQQKTIVMWDVLTQDYDQSINPELILKKSIAATSKGSIIVFHDNLKAEHNLKAVLPQYLQHFSSLGYRFDAL